MCATGGLRKGAALDSLTIDAPAKVNLYLNVLGSRPDGYHEIDTVMQTVDLTDTLELRRRPEGGVTLSVSGRTHGVPSDDGNLAVKAGRVLLRHVGDAPASPFGKPPGADIRLEKRIPAGAGLGGASSDAASVLVGLARLWGLSPAEDELLALAAELGSDVPFFVRGGAARCTGRGEKLQRLRAEGELHLVLVFSGFLRTAEIYELLDRSFLTKRHPNGRFLNRVDVRLNLGAVARAQLWNSLEEVTFEVCPELRDVKRELLDAGASAACVSGSGSCVFGTGDSPEQARRIAEMLVAHGREAVAVRSSGPRDL